jgi:hypothetical protein
MKYPVDSNDAVNFRLLGDGAKTVLELTRFWGGLKYSTGTRVNGKNEQCHILCNPLYTAYCTFPTKDRMTLLRVLAGGADPVFELNACALELLDVRSGKLDIRKPAPEDALDLLKTATPADFNNNSHLEWCYVILKGTVWQISEAPDGYQPQSQEKAELLKLLTPEHHSDL